MRLEEKGKRWEETSCEIVAMTKAARTGKLNNIMDQKGRACEERSDCDRVNKNCGYGLISSQYPNT